MHNLNKSQTIKALRILSELHEIAPDLVTAREAGDLCDKYNAQNNKFRRVAKARQNFQPFNLAQVAVEIVKKAAN